MRCYDLGPAWFWSGQPNMANLARELKVEVCEQYADGNLIFEDNNGAVQRNIQYPTMAGALRIPGGIERLTEELARDIPAHKLHLHAKLTQLVREHDKICASVALADQVVTVRASTRVLALPPRLAAPSIIFDPEPATDALNAMRAIPTWMAGHAKVITV
jgi:monoamine oxidase